MEHICKKCLLLEAGNRGAHEKIRELIDDIDDDLRANDLLYNKRISICQNCESLISGMCLKCGCYVELRAAYKNKSCPNYGSEKW